MGIPYYVGGSVASSAHGVARSSLDVDLVADLKLDNLSTLGKRLAGDYYFDEDRMRDAVTRRRSFNLIHLATMFKVDVFIMKDRAFEREAMRRATERSGFRVASREDVILAKLEWFRMGGETSERQWTDVLGVMRMAGTELDIPYLRRSAPELGALDLLERALAEASVL